MNLDQLKKRIKKFEPPKVVILGPVQDSYCIAWKTGDCKSRNNLNMCKGCKLHYFDGKPTVIEAEPIDLTGFEVEDDEFEDDLEKALYLLENVRDFLQMLVALPVYSAIQPEDKTEATRRLEMLDVFLNQFLDADEPPENEHTLSPAEWGRLNKMVGLLRLKEKNP